MAYLVEFVAPVLDFLAQVEGLSDNDRESIVAGVIEELSQHADRFLVLRPLTHESLCFRYDYPHPTAQAMYTFDFVVDARHLEMGVVRVVYAEYATEPMP